MHERYKKLYPEPNKKPVCRLELMTPELVDEIIALNTHNRKVKPQHRAYLAGEFMAGRYVITNNAFGLCPTFTTDGGHRAHGLRDAGYPPVYAFVARNLTPEAQKVIDLGTKRSMSDVLTLLLDSSVNNKVVAALNVRLRARSDWMRGKWNPDILLKEFEDCAEGIKKTAQVKGWSNVPAATRAAVLDAYYAHDKNDGVFTWFAQTIDGVSLAADDPALTYRKWSLKQTKSTGGNDMQIRRYWYATESLTAFVEKRKLSRFVMPVPDEKLPAWVKSEQIANRRGKGNSK